MRIVTVNERQHLNNDYECDICGGDNPVVGAVYTQRKSDFPNKHYCFRYCKACALQIAEQIAGLVHPSYKVTRD